MNLDSWKFCLTLSMFLLFWSITQASGFGLFYAILSYWVAYNKFEGELKNEIGIRNRR